MQVRYGSCSIYNFEILGYYVDSFRTSDLESVISGTTNRPPLSAGLKGCGILYSGRDIRYSFTLP